MSTLAAHSGHTVSETLLVAASVSYRVQSRRLLFGRGPGVSGGSFGAVSFSPSLPWHFPCQTASSSASHCSRTASEPHCSSKLIIPLRCDWFIGGFCLIQRFIKITCSLSSNWIRSASMSCCLAVWYFFLSHWTTLQT